MRRLLFLTAIALLFYTPTVVGAEARYTITGLNTLEGYWSSAYGINDSGQVVGYIKTSSNADHAFFYDETMHDLSILGGEYNYAYGINNSGQVVGYSDGHAFLYDGTMHDLGQGTAYGINDSGQVVGYSGSHAFLYTVDYDPKKGYYWTMHDLGTLSGNYSGAFGINNGGQVVGNAGTSDGYSHAFLYDGTMLDLGTFGGKYSWAYDINDSGQAVGWADTSSNERHAFIYDGTLQDLNDLIAPTSRWLLSEARGINNIGQIVGYGYNFSSGYEGAVLLTPVPEPSSLLALAGGLAGVGGMFMKRRNCLNWYKRQPRV